MTGQTPAEAAALLAELLGTGYDPASDPDVAMCELIETARRNGITWAQIGSVTIRNRDPKAAKAHAKLLARRVKARAFAAMPQEVDSG